MANMSKNKNPMPEQAPEVRSHNFDEVALGYTAELAMDEAERCLHCNHGSKPGSEQTTISVWTGNCDTHPAKRERHKQQDHRRTAKQTKILSNDGKDKIAFRIRQKAELLPSLPQPSAKQTSGADGNQRLRQLVPFVAHLCKGIAEGQ